MNENLSVMNIINILIKKWHILVIAAIIGCISAFIFTELFMQPIYSSGATLYVNVRNKKAEEITNADILASKELVNTYAEILRSRNFLEKVSRDLDYKYTSSQIKGMLSLKAVNATEVLAVNVRGYDKNDVYKIAQRMVVYAADELKNVIGTGSVTILENPLAPQSPVSPNLVQNMFIGILVGLILSGLVIVILDLLDTRIKNREDFVNNYEEPLLGEIPTIAEVQVTESRG